MRIYTLYKAFTATADAAVNVQIQQNGTIRQIEIITDPDLDADGERYTVEVGMAVSMQGRIHDSVGALAQVSEACAITGAAGGGASGKSEVIPCAYPVKAGDKVYLHGLLTGTTDVKATVLITVG
jgi:hypothetical protein